MTIGFDLINDLNLSSEDDFNWENKATSLYCIVAGNISSDLYVISTVLNNLSKFYQGVFYTPGTLEFKDSVDYQERILDICKIAKKIKNVAVLHHHVVIINGIAILGSTGYHGDEDDYDFEKIHNKSKFEDLIYLRHSVERLQRHIDVKHILMVTGSVPNHKLFFGEDAGIYETLPDLDMVCSVDLEKKISHWMYGSYEKIVDTNINGINYLSNPFKGEPYWAKRTNIIV